MMMMLFKDIPDGAVISEITPLTSYPNMRRVRIGPPHSPHSPSGKKTVATLRAADIDAIGLAIGNPWTPKLAQAVRVELAAGKARKAAMNLLGRRAYSKGELIDRLQRKGHDTLIAQRIADEMAADQWIDDAAYGRAIIHEISRSKPAGHQLLVSKLQARKLDPELAERIAREAVAGGDPLNEALKLARQRFQAMQALPAATARRRLAGLLARRGFDEEVVAAALARLGVGDDDAQD